MVEKIIWNKRASNKLTKIIDFLNEVASEKVVRQFVENVDEKISLIKKFPEIGRPSSKNKTIRFFRIDKHKLLYYRKKGNTIIIINIFDTRQNPNKNPY